jgi:hypothetical protein
MSQDQDNPEIEVRFVQPFEARKTYLCPGCTRDIVPGTHHIVAVPRSMPDERRHWHKGCWEARNTRRPTGRR